MTGGHAWLNIQQISNLGEVYQQIVIDIDLDNGIKRILNAYDIALKVIDSHNLSAGIHDPILTDSGIFVVVCLSNIII